MDLATTLPLTDGHAIPVLGLGVWQISDGKPVQDAVHWALEAGVRHIDTAKFYRNERGVGEAIRTSGIPREEIWVTTKLFPVDALRVEGAFQGSYKRLGLDYVDLYLVHFPPPGLQVQTWKKMESIAKRGLARSIGVSNYSIDNLKHTLAAADIPPSINQIQLSPFHYTPHLVDWCQRHSVVVEAYSPLARGHELDNQMVEKIADAHGKQPAHVLIRWALQHDFVVIPKSAHEQRIRANVDVFDFSLTPEEMHTLDHLRS